MVRGRWGVHAALGLSRVVSQPHVVASSVLSCRSCAFRLLLSWGCSSSRGPISSPSTSLGARKRRARASPPASFASQRFIRSRAPPSAARASAAPRALSRCRRRCGGRVSMRPRGASALPDDPAGRPLGRRNGRTGRPLPFRRQPLAKLTVAASYACRPMNHQSGGRLSEHGYANALDVSRFTLADGRRSPSRPAGGATSANGLSARGPRRRLPRFHDRARAELRRQHHDHFHLDLARHGRDGLGQTCK